MKVPNISCDQSKRKEDGRCACKYLNRKWGRDWKLFNLNKKLQGERSIDKSTRS